MPHVDIGSDLSPDPPLSIFDGVGGFVRSLTSFTPDHEQGKALLDAAHTIGRTPWVAGQFADPAVEKSNRRHWAMWRDQWRMKGAVVYQWWRVEHHAPDSPPLPDVGGIPNPEKQHEFDRLPRMLPFLPAAIATLGKAAGIDVDLLRARRVWVLAECFRETPTSDHTVTESYTWWDRNGFDMRRWTPMLQAYGTPFAALPKQAEEAKRVGCRGVCVYPLEGARPGELRQLGEVMA